MAQDPKNQQGIFLNPIIQSVINAVWFANPNDEGIVYTPYFEPISYVTIALVATVVSHTVA
jgi:Domain of unknown function (DUF6532)